MNFDTPIFFSGPDKWITEIAQRAWALTFFQNINRLVNKVGRQNIGTSKDLITFGFSCCCFSNDAKGHILDAGKIWNVYEFNA